MSKLLGLDLMYAVMRPYQVHSRERRMHQFVDLMQLKSGMRVVDLGGSPMIWQFVKTPLDITLVNLTYDPRTSPLGKNTGHHTFHHVVGDACATQFASDSFDLAFSNSVIEHVGGVEKQQGLAREASRLAPRHWVQTPAKWFPLEAHTGMPFWWFYPKRMRQSLVARWYQRDSEWASMIDGTCLVTRRDLERFFPDSKIFSESSFGFVKSYAAYRR